MTPTIDHTAYRNGRIVWAAILGGLVVLYVLLRVQLSRSAAPALTDASSQRTMFLVLSAAVVGAIILVDRGVFPLEPRPGASVAFLRHVVCWAQAEAIGLFGVILAFQTREVNEAHPFMLLAAGLLFWFRPRPERFPPDP
jgi:hypothetical protein